jgi:PAS domain S-box-containing protein
MSVRSFENRLFRPPVSYSVGVARDVSEHRRPLELLEELGMIYFKSDESGRRIYSSPGESDLTGYTGEELETLPRGALFVEPTLAQLIEKARSSGGRLAEQIVRIRHKESGSFPVQMSVRLVPGESEGKSGLEGFYRDVSERLKLQQFMDRSPDRVMSDAELAQAFAKHEQLHLDYMSSLGHQLLTPLTSLSQHALSLQRDIPRGRVSTRSFEYVVGQARCCIDLVRGWGYLDRILQREKFDTETSIVSLARISIHVKIDMKHLLPPKELDIRIDGESLDRHCQIPCHPGLIRQVIVNLFDNAIKYSYPGTVIEVRGDQNGECPVYEISNEGLEIPEDIRERIFDRGFRSSKAKKLIPHGTGLGLWLDTKILQCHGATISCSVRPDGARLRNVFRIEFPSPRRKREV